MNADDFVNQAKIATARDFLALIKRATAMLKKEQEAADGKLVHLPSSGKAIIVGDLHGDLESLTHILKNSNFLRRTRKGENIRLIFLGDYGDRGSDSIGVFYVVLKLKECFPDNVILMRGNHEGPEDLHPFPHDLPDRLDQKYGEKTGTRTYAHLRRLFNYLYNAVLIDDRAVLIHGGLPSEASSMEDLAYADTKHPQKSYLEDMLWSDPREGLKGVQPSPRGAGKVFGADITRKLLKMLNAKILVRGHEPCHDGFKINHNGLVLTIFSTNKSPYRNEHAAYLEFDLSKKINNAKQLKQCIRQL